MRFKLLLASVLIMSTMVLAGGTTQAEETKTILDITEKTTMSSLLKPVEEPPKPIEPVKDVVYEIKGGDTLESVSKAHTTTWKRLWDKNGTLAHPDVIKPGEKLTIPRSDEVLADRPLPTPPPTPVTAPSVRTPHVAQAPASVTPRVQQRGAVAGNTYTYGYCTWHVKNMRPDLPNNLGNADTWYYRAQAQGIPTGTTPRVGAAGMTKAYMHVVYITGVSGNTVTVSEMNYRGNGSGGFGIVSSRTAPASEFLYIY